MPEKKVSLLSFNIGIEQILLESEAGGKVLPPSSGLFPSDGPGRLHLDEAIRGETSLEEMLLARLSPEIQSRKILIPARYYAAMKETCESLKEEAEKRGASQPQRILNRAVTLLEREKDHLDLLVYFRNVLLQG
ncbi:MAG: hypothetical protein V2B13_19240 [Pseudomonadota bacterium]